MVCGFCVWECYRCCRMCPLSVGFSWFISNILPACCPSVCLFEFAAIKCANISLINKVNASPILARPLPDPSSEGSNEPTRALWRINYEPCPEGSLNSLHSANAKRSANPPAFKRFNRVRKIELHGQRQNLVSLTELSYVTCHSVSTL